MCLTSINHGGGHPRHLHTVTPTNGRNTIYVMVYLNIRNCTIVCIYLWCQCICMHMTSSTPIPHVPLSITASLVPRPLVQYEGLAEGLGMGLHHILWYYNKWPPGELTRK